MVPTAVLSFANGVDLIDVSKEVAEVVYIVDMKIKRPLPISGDRGAKLTSRMLCHTAEVTHLDCPQLSNVDQFLSLTYSPEPNYCPPSGLAGLLRRFNHYLSRFKANGLPQRTSSIVESHKNILFVEKGWQTDINNI